MVKMTDGEDVTRGCNQISIIRIETKTMDLVFGDLWTRGDAQYTFDSPPNSGYLPFQTKHVYIRHFDKSAVNASGDYGRAVNTSGDVHAVLSTLKKWTSSERWNKLVSTCDGVPCALTTEHSMHVNAFIMPPIVVAVAVDANAESLLVMVDEYMELLPPPNEVQSRVVWGARTCEFLRQHGKSVSYRPHFGLS